MTSVVAERLSTYPAQASPQRLAITIRHRDGSEEDTELTAVEHRAIHLDFLHKSSSGYVEIAAGVRDSDGELKIHTRCERDHFLPGGQRAGAWRLPLLELAAEHDMADEEVFVGVTPRVVRRAGKEDVRWSRHLWMDIDLPGHAAELVRLLERFPAHLEIATAGGSGDRRDDGHRHLYWLLAEPHAARTVTDRDTGRKYQNPREILTRSGNKGRPRIVGYRDLQSRRLLTNTETVDWIERWNLRLIHHLGQTVHDGKTRYIADKQCRERARVLRLAGTRNLKTGRYARIVWFDRQLAPYDIGALIGALPDPPNRRTVRRRDIAGSRQDPYRLIPAAVYFKVLAGIDLPAKGNIHCLSPSHPDVKPSLTVGDYVFHCKADHCDVQGTIYDLWSLLNGGPTGDALATDRPLFHTVAKEVRKRCGHLV